MHFPQNSPLNSPVLARISPGPVNVPVVKGQSQDNKYETISYDSISKRELEIDAMTAELTKIYKETLQEAKAYFERGTQEILRDVHFEQDEIYARNLDQPANANVDASQEELKRGLVINEITHSLNAVHLELQRDIFDAYEEALKVLQTELKKCRAMRTQLDDHEAMRLNDELNSAAALSRRDAFYDNDNKHN